MTEVEKLFAQALSETRSQASAARFLDDFEGDVAVLAELLKRPVPAPLLESVSRGERWLSDPRIAGSVVRNPRTPRAVALKLLPSLAWRDLALASVEMTLQPVVRHRAEAALLDLLPKLRLGDLISLARLAGGRVLILLLQKQESRVVKAALENPRLRVDALQSLIRQPAGSELLIREIAQSSRWQTEYRLRLELALSPRTPRSVALSQLAFLIGKDLFEVASREDLPLLVRLAAERLGTGQLKR